RKFPGLRIQSAENRRTPNSNGYRELKSGNSRLFSVFSRSLRGQEFRHGVGHGSADAGEPDGAAEIVIGVVSAGYFPRLAFFPPFRVERFGGGIDEGVGGIGPDIAG